MSIHLHPYIHALHSAIVNVLSIDHPDVQVVGIQQLELWIHALVGLQTATDSTAATISAANSVLLDLMHRACDMCTYPHAHTSSSHANSSSSSGSGIGIGGNNIWPTRIAGTRILYYLCTVLSIASPSAAIVLLSSPVHKLQMLSSLISTTEVIHEYAGYASLPGILDTINTVIELGMSTAERGEDEMDIPASQPSHMQLSAADLDSFVAMSLPFLLSSVSAVRLSVKHALKHLCAVCDVNIHDMFCGSGASSSPPGTATSSVIRKCLTQIQLAQKPIAASSNMAATAGSASSTIQDLQECVMSVLCHVPISPEGSVDSPAADSAAANTASADVVGETKVETSTSEILPAYLGYISFVTFCLSNSVLPPTSSGSSVAKMMEHMIMLSATCKTKAEAEDGLFPQAVYSKSSTSTDGDEYAEYVSLQQRMFPLPCHIYLLLDLALVRLIQAVLQHKEARQDILKSAMTTSTSGSGVLQYLFKSLLSKWECLVIEGGAILSSLLLVPKPLLRLSTTQFSHIVQETHAAFYDRLIFLESVDNGGGGGGAAGSASSSSSSVKAKFPQEINVTIPTLTGLSVYLQLLDTVGTASINSGAGMDTCVVT